MGSYGVTLEGVAPLIRRLQSEELLAKPARRIFSKVGTRGKAAAKAAAPRRGGGYGGTRAGKAWAVFERGGGGGLEGSITSKLSSKPVPSFVAIVVKAENKGYHYPRLLEFSTKHHHKEWLMTAIKGAVGSMSSLAREMAEEIEANFRRAA